ncbi:MAG: hypothetical protein R3B47_09200 [Bacteroidia bacterium]
MDTNEWLESYFDHRIVEVQRRELEAQAQEDPDLAHLLRTHRNALMGIEVLGEEKLRLELSRIMADWQELKDKRRTRQLRVTMAVGMFVIVASLAGWFGLRKIRLNNMANGGRGIESTTDTRLPEPARVKRPQPQVLAAQFFSPIDIDLKGIKSSHQRTANQAIMAYRDGNFSSAIPLLESIKDDYNKVPESLRMLLGIVYLADDQASDASRVLLPLMYGNSEYDDKARWYLALAYFRQGNIVQGMGLMEEVRKHDGHFNQDEAQRFLGQLKGETGI